MARVILTLMIKNEQRIVKRCVDRALRVADAVCVCDTGSTDGTLEALGSYLPTLRVPTKLVHSPWVDFGHTRTESMRATVEFCDELGWARKWTYSLVLDADMLLCVSDAFDKTVLEASAYLLRQDSASLSHCNIRLMRLSDPWRCVGPTHEYWECAELPSDREVLETAHIEDVGDGGCKHDKFERDERLLRAALETDPTNTRHMFYLAQTLRDVGKTDAAIEWYKRRAEAGGWTQEVWYSMYQTCAMYYKLRRMPEMEYWGLKAHEYLCSGMRRAECLYLLVRAFRVDAQYHKAWHYYELGRRVAKPGHDALFVEPEVYSRLFEYERTILSFYVLGPAKHAESLRDIVRYMNAHGTSTNTWSNMEFYVSRVPSARVRALAFPPIGAYVASSVSLLRLSDQEYLLNVRYVNYLLAPDGSYRVEGAARTRNFCVRCDADFGELGPPEEMEPDFPGTALCYEGAPQGLEDLRLYHDEDGGIGFVAASCEYSHDGTIKQVRGTYDAKARKLRSATSMWKEPGGKRCEKNWIPLGSRARFIYEWHPFTVGVCEEPDARVLVAQSAQPTPRFFERVRGSSNVVEYDGALYSVAHVVCDTGRRRYYHIVVRLRGGPDAEVEAYTTPFYFIKNQIEYCLGIEVRGGTLIAFVSQNDADPVVVEIPLGALDFHLLP